MNLYLHIGLHKTATTPLQHEIFNHHSEINYLGIPFNDILNEIMFSIRLMTEDSFQKKLPYLKNQFKKIELNKNKVNLLSSETYTNIFSSYNYDLNNTFSRIKLIFEEKERKVNIKIFFMIRKQVDLLSSRYAQDTDSFVKINRQWQKFQDFVRYFEINKNEEDWKLEKKIVNSFKFFEIYRQLSKLFKEDNVKVFVYEKLTEDQKKYLGEIANYLNVNVNEVISLAKNKKINISYKNKILGYPRKSFYIKRVFVTSFLYSKILSRIIPKAVKKYANLFVLIFYRLINKKNKIIIYDKQKKMVKQYYYEDNIQLDKNLNLDLERYHYF